MGSRYLKKERLADVLALIQVLALDEKAKRGGFAEGTSGATQLIGFLATVGERTSRVFQGSR
jgi:hypothetical protein